MLSPVNPKIPYLHAPEHCIPEAVVTTETDNVCDGTADRLDRLLHHKLGLRVDKCSCNKDASMQNYQDYTLKQ